MTDTLTEHADPTLHKGEPLIQMNDVGKTYGAIRALQGINLQVNAGEVTCVLGDNGAGKSTLIKIMSGLHPHTEGTLKVDGKEVTLRLAPRGAGPRHRHRLPGPRRRLADGGLAQLLPRLGARAGKYPLAPMKIKEMREIADDGAAEDGHHRQGHQPADRHAVRRSAAVRRDRPGGVLRRPGADPGRAHRRARRQAVRRGAQVHRRRPRRRPRRRVHHPQPAPRLPGRQPLHHPQARPARAGQEALRGHPRGTHRRDGRRPRARRALATSSERDGEAADAAAGRSAADLGSTSGRRELCERNEDGHDRQGRRHRRRHDRPGPHPPADHGAGRGAGRRGHRRDADRAETVADGLPGARGPRHRRRS